MRAVIRLRISCKDFAEHVVQRAHLLRAMKAQFAARPLAVDLQRAGPRVLV